MNRNTRLIDINVIINGKKYRDLIMNSTEGESSISKTDGIDLGACVSEYISFNIYDPLKTLSSNIVGKDIVVEYIVLNNSEYNKTYQNYYIIDTKRATDIFTIEAQDFLFKTEKNLSLITDLKSGTVKKYLDSIAASIGCTYTGIKHRDVLDITLNLDLKKYSGRDILSAIAAYNGGFCRMSNNHKEIEFVNLLTSYNKALNNNSTYNKTPMLIYDEVGEVLSLNGLQYDYSLQIGEYPYVHMKNNIILEHLREGDKFKEHLNKIQNELKQIKYSPSEGTMFFEPDVRGGDFVSFNSVNGDYITLLSSINYSLGGKIRFKSYAISLVDNLKPQIEEAPIIEEPEEPEPEPELPDFFVEIINTNKPKYRVRLHPDFAHIINIYSEGWIRVDTIDKVRFVPQNYNDLNYKKPGTEGYETIEGEWGDGSYTLLKDTGFLKDYDRLLTPMYSYNFSQVVESVDIEELEDFVVNFNDYIKVKDGAFWVKAETEYVGSTPFLIIPSSFEYTINLKNNNFQSGWQVYDDEYYKAYGHLSLVDKNNLAWYGLPDILHTYASDYMEYLYNNKIVNEGEKPAPSLYDAGVYEDLYKIGGRAVENALGGLELEDGRKYLLRTEKPSEGEIFDHVVYDSVDNIPKELKEREYLYTDYDSQDYHKILWLSPKFNETNNAWGYPGPNMNIPVSSHIIDYDKFYENDYLIDSEGKFYGVHYNVNIVLHGRDRSAKNEDDLRDMMFTSGIRDFDTKYYFYSLSNLLLEDMKNPKGFTKELPFKFYYDKGVVKYERKAMRSIDLQSDIVKNSHFYLYKDHGKERVGKIELYQKNIVRQTGETTEDYLNRSLKEYGDVNTMDVIDRDGHSYRVPITQIMENDGWGVITWRVIPEVSVLADGLENGLDRINFVSSPMNKVEDKYYWMLNVDKPGIVLDLTLKNNLNKELYLYTIKDGDIINKYVSLISDTNEATFLLSDREEYDNILIVGDYAALLEEGILYTKNRENILYTYRDEYDIIKIEDKKGVDIIWKDD